jgi:hypothetical protein
MCKNKDSVLKCSSLPYSIGLKNSCNKYTIYYDTKNVSLSAKTYITDDNNNILGYSCIFISNLYSNLLCSDIIGKLIGNIRVMNTDISSLITDDTPAMYSCQYTYSWITNNVNYAAFDASYEFYKENNGGNLNFDKKKNNFSSYNTFYNLSKYTVDIELIALQETTVRVIHLKLKKK